MRCVEDLAGREFRKLTAIERFARKGDAHWLCRCECGNEKVVSGSNLRNGSVGSCGCLLQKIITHGHSRGGSISSEYATWAAMKYRCSKATAKSFRHYGGRGITVCERWSEFRNFLEDVGFRPSPSHSLDRINNDGNYEPGNVRWATRSEQTRNRRCSIPPVEVSLMRHMRRRGSRVIDLAHAFGRTEQQVSLFTKGVRQRQRRVREAALKLLDKERP